MIPMKIESHEVAIIIPTYNEKENIKKTIGLIKTVIPSALIYVVDDNSPDKTSELVKEMAKKKNSNIFLIVREKKNGRGGAVLEGMRKAIKNKKTKYFVEMDADLSHSPKQIPRILGKRKNGIVVIGSRYIKGSKIVDWPIKRIVLSNLANRYISQILQMDVHDFTGGFRCYPRKAVKIILNSGIKQKGFIALSEILYLLSKHGFRFIEVPITFKDRTKGVSNATTSEVLKSLLAVIQIRFDKQNNKLLREHSLNRMLE